MLFWPKIAPLSYLKRFVRKGRKVKSFYDDFNRYNKLDTAKRFSTLKSDFIPCVDDNTTDTSFDAHYIYHPAWAARVIKSINPDLHIDIASALSFSTVLSAFIQTEFYDYRPAKLTLTNLACKYADLNDLAFTTDSIHSLSCMHTIEHVGLGRYGDPVDPEGDIKAIHELKRVCAINGNLLIVVPVGMRKIQFNAHRIYNPFDLINYMDGFKLREFSLINDLREFIENADLNDAATQSYGCGCYWFIKEKK